MAKVSTARKVGQRVKATSKPSKTVSKHAYFAGIAESRYVLRKVFHLIEEEAKRAGLDSLAHQALIQVYGSKDMMLRVKDVAERLDVSPAFASGLIRILTEKKYLARRPSTTDKRETCVTITPAGMEVIHAIDQAVRVHIDYFIQGLTQDQREAAVVILMHYVRMSGEARELRRRAISSTQSSGLTTAFRSHRVTKVGR